MNKILSGLCASTLALSFALAAVAQVNAAPAFVTKAPESSGAGLNVQYDPTWRRAGNRLEHRMERRLDRRQVRRADRNFERRGKHSYYNGHRGYDGPRRGYREHNGLWFPAAAFVAGAMLGGTINNQPPPSGGVHVDWCYDRYRSYRAYDNTFQPYNGPRQRCYSPYS